MRHEEEARPGTPRPTHADDEAIVMNGAPAWNGRIFDGAGVLCIGLGGVHL